MNKCNKEICRSWCISSAQQKMLNFTSGSFTISMATLWTVSRWLPACSHPSLSTLHYPFVKISNEHAYHLFYTASNAWEEHGIFIHRRQSSFQSLSFHKMPTKIAWQTLDFQEHHLAQSYCFLFSLSCLWPHTTTCPCKIFAGNKSLLFHVLKHVDQ